MQKLFLFLVLAVALSACKTANVKGEQFGDALAAKGAVPYEKMLTKMEGVDSMQIKVVGEVSAVCQMKGCWMNMTAGVPDKPEMMIQFKDYGFFVPKDIAGRKVIIDGYAYREVTSVDDLRHFAEDAGKSKEEIEAITKPKEELKFLASGVLLLSE